MHLENLSKSGRCYKLCGGCMIVISKCEYTKVTKSVTDKAGYDQRHLRTDLYGKRTGYIRGSGMTNFLR